MNIASLLAKGTGPERLRSTLRLKTKPLGALMRMPGTLKALRTEMPPSVLGGDLLRLLSDRMRESLQNQDQPPATVTSLPARNSKFVDQADFAHLSKSAFSLNSERKRSSAGALAAWKPAFQERDSFSAPPVSQSIVSPVGPFAPQRLLEASHPSWKPAKVMPDISRDPFLPSEGHTTARRRNDGAMRSLLDEKLREYWELSRPQQPPEKGSHEIASVEAKSNASVAPQPLWRSRPQVPQSWPGITGQQLTRKIYSLTSGASSSRSQQTINSGSPDKVEIQNVFNIEVKPSGVGAADSSDDLSERISDILRQQALQHGIDVT